MTISSRLLSATKPIHILNFVLFALPLFYLPGLRDPSSMPRYFLLGLATSVLMMYWGWQVIKQHRSILWHPALSLLFLYVLYAVISNSWSSDPHTSLIETIQLVSMAMLAMLVFQYSDSSTLPTTLKWVLISASLAAFIGILQNFNYNPLDLMELVSPASTFTNKNFAALYFDLVIPVALLIILLQDTTSKRWLYSLPYFLTLTFILCSHTRGSWLGLVIAIFSLIIVIGISEKFRKMLIERYRVSSLPILITTILAFLIINIPGGFLNLPSGVLSEDKPFERVESVNIRKNAYFNALNMIKDHPVLGTGHGGFRHAFRDYAFSWPGHELFEANENLSLERLHSDILQQFVDLGIPGGLLFVALLLWIMRTAYVLFKYSRDANEKLLVSALGLALTVSIVHATVDFPFQKPASAALFWVWAGFILSLDARRQSHLMPALSNNIIRMISGFAALLLAFNIYFYSIYIQGSRQLLLAEESYRNKDCASALSAIDKSMDVFGYDFATKMNQVIFYSTCPAPFHKILVVMENALSYDPTNTRALLTRGHLRLQLRDFHGSEQDFQELVRLLPHRASGYAGLALVAYGQHNYPLAQRYAQQAFSKDPKDESLQKLLRQVESPG